MDVYYQVEHRLQAPKLAFHIDFSVVWTDGHMITKISQMDRLANFLRSRPLGLRMRGALL